MLNLLELLEEGARFGMESEFAQGGIGNEVEEGHGRQAFPALLEILQRGGYRLRSFIQVHQNSPRPCAPFHCGPFIHRRNPTFRESRLSRVELFAMAICKAVNFHDIGALDLMMIVTKM